MITITITIVMINAGSIFSETTLFYGRKPVVDRERRGLSYWCVTRKIEIKVRKKRERKRIYI